MQDKLQLTESDIAICLKESHEAFDAFLIGNCKGEPPRSYIALASQLFKTILANPEKPIPNINIKCETKDNDCIGTTFLNVVRIEREDDGSLTVVTDHWPVNKFTT